MAKKIADPNKGKFISDSNTQQYNTYVDPNAYIVNNSPDTSNTGNNFYSPDPNDTKVDYTKTSLDPAISQEDLPNLENIRAKNQSVLGSLGDSTAKLVGKTATSVAGNILGTIYGAGDAIANGDITKLWDNGFMDKVDDIDKGLDNIFKTYKSSDYQDQNILQRAFLHPTQFIDDATNTLSFSAGAIISDMLTAGISSDAIVSNGLKAMKYLSSGSEALEATNNLSSLGIKALHMAGDLGETIKHLAVGASYEGIVEAREATMRLRDKMHNDWQMEHPNEQMPSEVSDDIDDRLSKIGVSTYLANLALVGGTNLLLFPKTFGLGHNSSKIGEGSIVKNAEGLFENAANNANPYLTTAKVALTKPVEEGAKFGLQAVIKDTAGDFWDRKNDPASRQTVGDFISNFGNHLIDTYTSKEGWNNIGMGMIIGLLGAPGPGLLGKSIDKVDSEGNITSQRAPLWQGGIKGAFQEHADQNRRIQEVVDDLNQHTDLIKSMKNNYDFMVQHNSLQNDQDSLDPNDKFNFMNTKDDQTHAYISARLKNNMYGDVLDSISQMEKMKPEDFYSQFNGEDKLANSTPEEQIDFKSKLIDDFKQKAENTREAFKIADGIYNETRPDFHPDVKEELIHAIASSKNLDLRESQINRELKQISNGAILPSVLNESDTVSIGERINDIKNKLNDPNLSNEDKNSLNHDLGILSSVPDVKLTPVEHDMLANFAKLYPTDFALNKDDITSLLDDTRKVRERRQKYLGLYNSLFTKEGQQALADRIEAQKEASRQDQINQEQATQDEQVVQGKKDRVEQIKNQVNNNQNVSEDSIPNIQNDNNEINDPFANINTDEQGTNINDNIDNNNSEVSQELPNEVQDVLDIEDSKDNAVEEVIRANDTKVEKFDDKDNESDITQLNNSLNDTNLDYQRTIGNTISYLAVDKLDYKIDNKTINKYDSDGKVQLSKQLDTRLQSSSQFKPGDKVSMRVPTFEEMQERGLDNYSREDFNKAINDVKEFPIAITDSNNKIVGYLPTQSGIDRLVKDEYKDVALQDNLSLRQNIFDNKDQTYQTTITQKTDGNLLTNKINQSLYNALGDGSKLGDKVELAIGKELSFRISPLVSSNKNILNQPKEGKFYAIVPTSKENNYIATPMRVNTIGKDKANTILQAILANKSMDKQSSNLGEYDLSKGKELFDFINRIVYSTNTNSKTPGFENHLLELKGDKLILGLTKDLVFDLKNLSIEDTSRILDTLSNRYSAVRLNDFNKPFISYNHNNGKFESTNYKSYNDYLNKENIVSTNVQGFKVEGTNNEYFYTAQSVIGLDSNIPTKQVENTKENNIVNISTLKLGDKFYIGKEEFIISTNRGDKFPNLAINDIFGTEEPLSKFNEVSTSPVDKENSKTQVKKVPKKTMRMVPTNNDNQGIVYNFENENKSAVDIYYVAKDIFSAQQQKEVVNTLIYQLNQVRDSNPDIKSAKELFNITKQEVADMVEYLQWKDRDDIVNWDKEQQTANYLQKIVDHFNDFIPKIEQKLNLLGTTITSRNFNDIEKEDNSISNSDESSPIIEDSEAMFQKLNYSDESTFSTSTKDTASAHMKQLLAFTPKYEYNASTNKFIEVPNSFGMPYYEDLDVIWSDLQRSLKGVPQNKMQDTLLQLGETNDRYKAIYNTIFNNSPLNIQKEFLVTFSKQQAEFVTVKSTKPDANDNKSLRVFGTNRAGADDIIINGWYENFTQSGILDTTPEGEKSINSDKGKQLSTAYQIALDHYSKDPIRSLQAITSLFNKVGINLSPDLLSNQKDNIIREDGTKYTLENWLKSKGKYIFDRLSGKFQVEADDSLAFNNPFIDEVSQLKTLAKLQLKYTPSLFEGSFISGDGKAKYSYVNHTYLSHLFETIQNDDNNEYVQALAQTAYASNSHWLDEITNNPDFKKSFALKYLDTLGSDATNQNNKSFKDMSTKEKEFTRIALYQNQGNKVGSFINIIPSDKTTIPLIQHNKVEVKVNDDGTIRNQEPIDRFMNIFKSEYARVALTLEQNKEPNKYNIIGYHGDKGMGSKFLTLDKFNDLIKDNQIKVLDDNDFKVIRNDIEKYINKLISDQKDYWKQNDLFDGKILDKSWLKSVGLGGKDKFDLALNQLVAEYTINQFLHNFNYTQVIGGDPALHGKKTIKATWINYSKRMAKDIAPGLDPAFNTTNYNLLQLKDNIVTSKHFDEYKSILGDKADAYKKINAADAQEYTTLQEHLDVMEAMGRLTPELKDISEKIKNNTATDKELSTFIAQPQKPVQVSSKIEDNINKLYYIKTSSFPLIPQLTKGLNIDKLRIFMESNNIQRASYESGIKLGLEGNLADSSNNFDNLDINNTKLLQINRSGFRIQQEIPYHGHNNMINEGSQGRKLILNNVSDNDIVHYNGKDITGAEAKDTYEKLHIEKYNRAFSQLKSDIGYNEDIGQFEDLSKLQSILKAEAESREYPLDDVYALQVVKDDNGKQVFKLPLGFTKNSSRLESIMNSLVTNKIIKSELPGFASVQGSNVGFAKNQLTSFDKLSQEQKASIIWVNPKDTELGYISKGDNKNISADIIVPQYLRHNQGHKIDTKQYLNEDGSLDTNKIPEDLLKTIGQRIPTQGYNSMMVFKVKGFLPDTMGDLAIVPAEITAQMGADFDVDKLFLYNYHHEMDNEGNLSKIKFDGDISKSSDKQLDNGIIQMFEDRLSDPKLLDQILEPNGFGKLPELAEELGSKDNHNYMTTIAQNDIHNVNNDGKAGTGIFSLFSTFLKAAQDSKLSTTNTFYYKDSNDQVKELRDLYEINAVNGNKKSAIISYFQSASVDNAKEQILGSLNINGDTMGVAGTMALLGYDEEFIGRFLSQPILKDYVQLNQNKLDLTDPKFDPDFDKKVFDKLKAKYNINLDKAASTVNDLKDTSIPLEPLSIDDLKKSPDPLNILNTFSNFKQYADLIRSIQAAISTDTNGLGARFVDMTIRKQMLDSIASTELLTGIEDLFDENKTIGKSIDLLYKSSRMFSEVLPYEKPAYVDITKNVLAYANKSDKINAKDLKTIYDGVKSYIVSNENFINNIQQERERILFGQESLAKRWNEYSLSPIGLKNILTKKIKADFAKKTGDPDLLKSINTPASNNSLDINDSNMRFIEMYNNGSELEKELSKDITKYYLLSGAQYGPNSISKYIPIDVLEKEGYTNKLREVESKLNEVNLFENATEQIFQHNPKLALPIPTDITKLDSNISLNIDSTPIIKLQDGSNKVDYAPYLSSYDNKTKQFALYKLNGVENNRVKYTKIDTLGNNNIAEYNAIEPNQQSLIKNNKSGNILKASTSSSIKEQDEFDYTPEATKSLDISPIDKLKQSIDFDSKNIENILNNIVKNSTFPTYQKLAKDLLSTSVVNNIKIDESNNHAVGQFDPSTNTLSLNFNAIQQNFNNPQEGLYKTVLHETLHALTINKIHSDNLSPQDRTIVNKITRLYNDYISSVDSNELKKFNSILDNINKGNKVSDEDLNFYRDNRQDLYALTNLDEFISAGLTDSKFVNKLKAGNFWTKFADYIQKLLGLKPSNDFEALYNLSLELGRDNSEAFKSTIANNTEIKSSPYQSFIDKVGYYPSSNNVKSVGVTFKSVQEGNNWLSENGLTGEYIKDYLGSSYFSIDKPIQEIPSIAFNVENESNTKSLQDQYIDKSINKTKQLINSLENKVKVVGRNVENQIKLDKLNERLNKLQSERSLTYVVDSSASYIKDIKDDLTNRKDSIYTPEEIMSIRDNLGFLSKMSDYIEFDDSFNELNDKVTLLSKQADKLSKDFNKKAVETLQYYATNTLKVDIDLQSILDQPLKDIGKLSSEFTDYTQSKSDLIQFLGAIRDNANHTITEDLQHQTHELNELITNYLKNNKNYDKLLQKDNNSKNTGNFLNKYSAEYWRQLKEVSGTKDYYKFAKSNMDFTIDEKAWEEAQNQFKELYPDWDKYDSDDYNEYNRWKLNNDPSLYLDKFNNGRMTSRDAERYIIKKPKDKWIDKDYAKLKALPEDSPERQLFDKIDEILRPLNKKYGNQVNYIPEINQSIMQYFMTQGVKGGLGAVGKSLLDSISTTVDPVTTNAYINELTGEPHQLIPIYMMSNNLDPNQKSYDLGKVLTTVIQQELALQQKHNAEATMLLTKALIEDAKIIKTNKQGDSKVDKEGNIVSVSNIKSNLLDQSRFIVDEFLYGKVNKSELASKFELPNGKVLAYDRVLDTLVRYTRAKGMGINPFSAAGNFLFGSVSNFIYASGREEFNESQAFKAWGVMLNSLLPNSPNAKKISALMHYFDVEAMIDQVRNGHTPGVKNTTGTNLSIYELQKRTEYFVQGQTLLAYLMNKKVIGVDGKEYTYLDAFDKNGKWDESKFGENPYKDDTTKRNEKLAIKDVISDIHGNYSKPIKFKENWYGRALMIFRTWLPQAIQVRFGEEQTNIVTGKTKKGRYRSYAAMALNSNGKLDLGQLKNNLLWSIGAMKSNSLSDIDKANMRKNISELATTAIVTMMMLFLKAQLKQKDDKDKSYTTYVLNSLSRTQSDLTFFMLPSSATTIMRDPIPAMKSVSDMIDLLPAAWNLLEGNDIYKAGPRKGNSKFMKKVGDVFPVVTQIDKNINYSKSILGSNSTTTNNN